MELPFQLHMLVNPSTAFDCPYAGIHPGVGKVVHASEDFIYILNDKDSPYNAIDYLPVSRFFTLDVSLLDRLVEDYTGQKEYSIITRFNEQKHITLTYHSPTNEGLKDYDIFLGYPDERAENLVNEIHQLMLAVKHKIFELV